ncbi:hypothetical protein Syun_022667 [Stephania yunnanensis]|uniref:Uncharacterized protein n=1 Tax=Stephania yunnanensis TaxID=152371 RepID=A0AAP0F7F5_9MAGN
MTRRWRVEFQSSAGTDRGLVRHRDNMFHTDRDFNVLVWECGQSGYITNTCSKQRAGTTEPVAYSCYCRASLTYIDERRQMMCSLLGGHGGAQLVTEEPSLSRRSPARHGGAQLVAKEPSPTEYGDAASDDRVCLALPRLCDPDPVAPAFGGLRLLGLLSILFPLTLILDILLDFTYPGSSISCLTECRSTVQQGEDSIAR